MPLGTFICRDFSVLLVRPTEAPRTCSTNEGGAQKHRRRKCPHAPSVRMFPGTLMGAKVRDGYGPMSPSATAIGPSGMGQSTVPIKQGGYCRPTVDIHSSHRCAKRTVHLLRRCASFNTFEKNSLYICDFYCA